MKGTTNLRLLLYFVFAGNIIFISAYLFVVSQWPRSFEVEYNATSSRPEISVWSTITQTWESVSSWIQTLFVKHNFPILPCPEACFVTVKDGGRLGNKLGEYASALGIASVLGADAYVPHSISSILQQYFEGIHLPLSESVKHCSSKLPTVHVDNTADMYFLNKPPFNTGTCSTNIILKKYTFMPQYFANMSSYFKFKSGYISHATRVKARAKLRSIAPAVKARPTFVGVHVRRTDYKSYLETKNRSMVGPDFFHTAIDYYRAKYKYPIFLVASDDVAWCRENLQPLHNVFLVADLTKKSGPVTDLATLASCDHSIFDYGTYGFWGAFLAGGHIVVADSVFPGRQYQSIFQWTVL